MLALLSYVPYDSRMTWALDSTEDYDLWFESLADDEQERVVAAARMLRQDGPTLGRPLVDQIKMPRHAKGYFSGAVCEVNRHRLNGLSH